MGMRSLLFYVRYLTYILNSLNSRDIKNAWGASGVPRQVLQSLLIDKLWKAYIFINEP